MCHLVTGKVEDFARELSYLLETVVSYHDTTRNPEVFYHGLLNSMLSPKNYEIVKMESEVLRCRCDTSHSPRS